MAYEWHDGTVRKRKYDIVVTLACGCQTRMRLAPLREATKLGCTNGMGHGYSLAWTEWTDESRGITMRNRTLSERND